MSITLLKISAIAYEVILDDKMQGADLQPFLYYYPAPSQQCVPEGLSKLSVDANLTTHQQTYIPRPDFSCAWDASHCSSVRFQLHIHPGIQNSLDQGEYSEG
jgi:hypothetical protein